MRANIFQQNYARIIEENFNKENTFTLDINEFADWTSDEFKRMLSPIKTEYSNSTTSLVNSSDCIPTSIDWRNEIAVNKVKDQGRFCASGWAFSAVAALEGRFKIKTGTLYTLSEQQLMDCNYYYGNYGCEGGRTQESFEFARDLGMTNEAGYPYVGVKKDPKDCAYNPYFGPKLAQPTGYTDVIRESALELKAAIASGPVSVAI